jgi:hypothetical protein
VADHSIHVRLPRFARKSRASSAAFESMIAAGLTALDCRLREKMQKYLCFSRQFSF